MADIIHYDKKRVLVIEDHGEFRSSMRGILDLLGAKTIDTASSGEAGLEYLRKNKYDIILSDYELGKGADGQQILEETRFSGLVKNTAVYVLITAATTVEMVMGALEFEPDGYITKPITFKDLQTRLNRILKTKAIFFDIENALDQKKPEDALAACDKVINEQPKHSLKATRTKVKILLELQRYDEAIECCEQILEERNVTWAKLGIGKAYYYKKEYDEAEIRLNELAEEDDRFADALDWLAKIYVAKENFERAQDALIEAVKRSPKSVLRQQALGEAAFKNDDWTVAEKAYRKAVSLGKDSCFKSSEAYLSLTKTLQNKIQNNSGRFGLEAFNEALRLLDTVEKEYSRRDEVLLESSILRGATYINMGGKDAEVKKALAKVQKLFDDYPGHVPRHIGEEYANVLRQNGQEDDADGVLQTL